MDIAKSVLEEYDRAIEHYKRSLEANKGDKEFEAITLHSIGSFYTYKREHKEAVEYFRKSLTISEETNDTQLIMANMLNLGNECIFLKDYRNAKTYLTKGIERAEDAGAKHWEANGYSSFGRLYIDIDLGRYEEAKEYLLRSVELAKSIGAVKVAESAQILLSKLKKKLSVSATD
ncbi:MAG: tetratricopeptide repeat protein [Campylobacterota bacterium]|nr:tetratricopeptide repeat protein [Campylobacterota bacterium]